MEQFDSTMSSVIDSTLGLRCKLFGYCHYCVKKLAEIICHTKYFYNFAFGDYSDCCLYFFVF